MGKSQWKQSFATRMGFWVGITAAVVMIVLSLVVYLFISAGIMLEAEKRAEATLDNAGDHIDKVLIEVETAVRNTLPDIESHLNRPERFNSYIAHLVSANPVISGAAIAMEADYFPGAHWFMPYTYDIATDQADTLTFSMLGSENYDYLQRDWFKIPVKTGKGYWSEPYLDEGGGGFVMTTYSYPLRDKKGKIRGIVTADISLDWLSSVLQQVDITDNSRVFVIDRKGTFITHPRKEYILNESIFSLDVSPQATDVGIKMVNGETGSDEFKNPTTGETMLSFYGPIPKNGWSMAIICPRSEFFKTTHVVNRIVFFLEMLGLLIIILVCHLLLRKFTRPLTEFAASADAVAGGNLHAPLPEIKRKDELWSLRNSLVTMQNSLEEQMQELKVVNEANGRIEGELQSARVIQESMLPKAFPPFPDCPNVAAYGLLTPAKEVGGDLFDVFVRNGKVFFCIGDVSGKGVPASLLMAVTRSLFHSMINRSESPAEMVTRMNSALSESNPQSMFVTLFAAILDSHTGHLRYCNAGHNAPLLVQKDGASYLSVLPNLPLGIEGGWQFEEQELTMAPGESVFLYTDGLTEAENIDKELFGEDRTLEVAKGLYGKDVKAQVEAMSHAVAAYVDKAPQSDDLTLLSILYNSES